MRSPWRCGALVALAGFLASDLSVAEEPGPAPPGDRAPASDPDLEDAPAPLLARIDEAITKGVAWLRKRPAPSGSYGDVTSGGTTYSGGTDVYVNPYGATALALYALLKCGVSPEDPVVRRGFAFLRKKEANGGNAYEISMKLLAVTATADPFKRTKDSAAAGGKVRLVGDMRRWAERLTEALVAMRAPNGWRYWGKGDDNQGGPQDLSSTQLATLALFAAERCGIRVAPEVWTGVIEFTLAQQERSGPERPRAVLPRPPPGPPAPRPRGGTTDAGPAPDEKARDKSRGFAYILGRAGDEADRVASGGMTACGVGCLMAARFQLLTRHPKVWAAQDADRVQAGVYDGLAWLDAHWSPFTNPVGGKSRWHLYYVYCVERAMDLVGSQRLGAHLWYVEMAEQVLTRQRKEGFWDTGSTKKLSGEVLDTCFALLFLRRATRGGIPLPSVTGGADEPAVDGR